MDDSNKPTNTTSNASTEPTVGESLEQAPDTSSQSTNETVVTPSTLERSDAPVEQPTEPAKKPKLKRTLNIKNLASRLNIYFLLFIFVILIAIFVIFLVVWRQKQVDQKTALSNTITGQALTAEELAKLQSSETKIGDPKQTLSVDANTSFAGNVLVKGGLDVAGAIRVGNSLSLPGITVSGNSSLDQVSANKLSIAGDTTIQGLLNVTSNATVNGSMTIGGTLTASKLVLSTLQVDGDAVMNRHISTGGPQPSRTNGTALGGGGTSSVSGTDTAGTVTINIGTGPAAGIFINVKFANSFKRTPHVVITPVGSSAAALNYYINRDANGFSIGATNAAPSNTNFQFDYIVID